jgi:hypothetical protein
MIFTPTQNFGLNQKNLFLKDFPKKTNQKYIRIPIFHFLQEQDHGNYFLEKIVKLVVLVLETSFR